MTFYLHVSDDERLPVTEIQRIGNVDEIYDNRDVVIDHYIWGEPEADEPPRLLVTLPIYFKDEDWYACDVGETMPLELHQRIVRWHKRLRYAWLFKLVILSILVELVFASARVREAYDALQTEAETWRDELEQQFLPLAAKQQTLERWVKRQYTKRWKHRYRDEHKTYQRQ